MSAILRPIKLKCFVTCFLSVWILITHRLTLEQSNKTSWLPSSVHIIKLCMSLLKKNNLTKEPNQSPSVSGVCFLPRLLGNCFLPTRYSLEARLGQWHVFHNLTRTSRVNNEESGDKRKPSNPALRLTLTPWHGFLSVKLNAQLYVMTQGDKWWRSRYLPVIWADGCNVGKIKRHERV